MGQLLWPDACARVQVDDGLAFRDVGAWSEDKLHVWHKYIQTTTWAMVDKPAWKSGLVYVDLFSGPGVCRVKGTSRRLPGSPLIAALAPKPFRQITLVENDAVCAAACESRLGSFGCANRSTVFRGDCNELIGKVVSTIPRGALTLAFVDPEALDTAWETVEQLAGAGRVDLLILFADAYDAVRNLDRFLSGEDSRLARVMGEKSKWRDRVSSLPNWEGNTLREFFSREYTEQLRTQLGYQGFGTKIVRGPMGPMYRLIYASKHERGVDFWNKVDAVDKRGQAGLFGP